MVLHQKKQGAVTLKKTVLKTMLMILTSLFHLAQIVYFILMLIGENYGILIKEVEYDRPGIKC